MASVLNAMIGVLRDPEPVVVVTCQKAEWLIKADRQLFLPK